MTKIVWGYLLALAALANGKALDAVPDKTEDYVVVGTPAHGKNSYFGTQIDSFQTMVNELYSEEEAAIFPDGDLALVKKYWENINEEELGLLREGKVSSTALVQERGSEFVKDLILGAYFPKELTSPGQVSVKLPPQVQVMINATMFPTSFAEQPTFLSCDDNTPFIASLCPAVGGAGVKKGQACADTKVPQHYTLDDWEPKNYHVEIGFTRSVVDDVKQTILRLDFRGLLKNMRYSLFAFYAPTAPFTLNPVTGKPLLIIQEELFRENYNVFQFTSTAEGTFNDVVTVPRDLLSTDVDPLAFITVNPNFGRQEKVPGRVKLPFQMETPIQYQVNLAKYTFPEAAS